MAELATLARPRYHFAGTKNTFYARPPYLNTDLGAGAHVTRFIGLASVANVAKQKSLHALGLVPAADMDIETLQQKPEVRRNCCFQLPVPCFAVVVADSFHIIACGMLLVGVHCVLMGVSIVYGSAACACLWVLLYMHHVVRLVMRLLGIGL